MSINWASKTIGTKVVDYSSNIKGCSADNVLDDNISKIWLSEEGLPQWISLSLQTIEVSRQYQLPVVIRSIGWHVWHKYTTNPRTVKLHVSVDGLKFKLWDSLTSSHLDGTQLFSCAPISIALYPFIAFEITETFGGDQTYLNRIFLYADEVQSTPLTSVNNSVNVSYSSIPDISAVATKQQYSSAMPMRRSLQSQSTLSASRQSSIMSSSSIGFDKRSFDSSTHRPRSDVDSTSMSWNNEADTWNSLYDSAIPSEARDSLDTSVFSSRFVHSSLKPSSSTSSPRHDSMSSVPISASERTGKTANRYEKSTSRSSENATSSSLSTPFAKKAFLANGVESDELVEFLVDLEVDLSKDAATETIAIEDVSNLLSTSPSSSIQMTSSSAQVDIKPSNISAVTQTPPIMEKSSQKKSSSVSKSVGTITEAYFSPSNHHRQDNRSESNAEIQTDLLSTSDIKSLSSIDSATNIDTSNIAATHKNQVSKKVASSSTKHSTAATKSPNGIQCNAASFTESPIMATKTKSPVEEPWRGYPGIDSWHDEAPAERNIITDTSASGIQQESLVVERLVEAVGIIDRVVDKLVDRIESFADSKSHLSASVTNDTGMDSKSSTYSRNSRSRQAKYDGDDFDRVDKTSRQHRNQPYDDERDFKDVASSSTRDHASNYSSFKSNARPFARRPDDDEEEQYEKETPIPIRRHYQRFELLNPKIRPPQDEVMDSIQSVSSRGEKFSYAARIDDDQRRNGRNRDSDHSSDSKERSRASSRRDPKESKLTREEVKRMQMQQLIDLFEGRQQEYDPLLISEEMIELTQSLFETCYEREQAIARYQLQDGEDRLYIQEIARLRGLANSLRG
jgi:hypothetical protein